MKKPILLAVLFLCAVKFSAQEKIPFIDLDTIYEQLSNEATVENYAKNIELLNKINKNDSSYCRVLVSKSYYQLNSEKYEETLKTIDEGLSKGCEDYDLSLYINKGFTYTLMEAYEKAIEVYNTALKKYPKNAELWCNKGLAYENAGNIEEAIKAYKISITLKPTYGRPHLQLGNICYKQQRISQALMCFNIYLILIIDEENAFSTLQSLNNAVSSRNENEVNPDLVISKDDDAFDELDLILNNKIALNKKYKTGHKIEIALTNQNHAMLEQLKNFEGNEGFWDKKYVAIHKWIAENNHFENFIYTLCYSIENEKYSKIVKSNEKNIIEFLKKFYNKWRSILRSNIIEFEGKTQEVSNFYYDNYTQAVGKMEGETSVGKWLIYNENGQLASEGTYDKNGKRDGAWTWYYTNGKIKETANYNNTKLNGENRYFYDNGKPKYIANYKDGKLDGEYLLYNEKGGLYEKKYFKASKLDGLYQSYFDVGETLIEWDVPYKNGDVASVAKEYYANGDVYADIPFVNGKRHGIEKKYNFRNALASEISYANGELNGAYKTYHTNGNIRKEGVSIDNYYNGPFKTYYRDGTLESDEIYNNGSLDGENKYFDTDGKLHSEFLYRKGEIIAYKYFDKAGKILKEAKKKGGKFQFNGFSPQGIKFSEGIYDIKGGKEGLWKYYSKNGVLTGKGKYTDNKLFGEYITYYNNGERNAISQYENDSLNGYYVQYHKNGKMKQQGWYKNNTAQGEWRNYYIDGTLQEINFYHNGELYGEQNFYAVNGKPERNYIYKKGKFYAEAYFDDQGKIVDTIYYRPENNDFKVQYKYNNGQTDLELDYINSIKHGKYISYDYYGNVSLEGAYNNGEMDGKWTWFYPDGSISFVKHYRDGNLHGELLDYYKNGKLNGKEVYEFGKLVGISTEYHDNGEISQTTEYVYGKSHGRTVFFDNSGKLQLIRFYNNGRLIGYSHLDTNSQELPMIPIENETGIIKAYFDNGNVSREMEYKNGQLVNNYKEYYYSGQLESNLNFIDGDYDGKITYYYANGNMKKEGIYTYGVLNGTYTKYYKNGKTKEVIPYVNGTIHGANKYYDTSGKLTKEELYFNGDVYKSQTF